MPCAAATAFPSSTSPVTSARRSGRSQTRPCVRPVSAPIGFVEALKMTLRHCGPRASSTACRRHPGARARVGEALDLAERRPLVVRAERRVALARPTARGPARAASRPGRSCRGSRARRAAAIVSSLPSPFWTVATQPSAKACAVAAIAGSVCIAFVATMPKSHGGSSAASLVARGGGPTTSPAPESRRPSRLIAATCSSLRSNAQTSTSSSSDRFAANSDHVQLVQVERPDLDVVEQRQVRREQRPDRPAADDRDPHSE